MPPPLIEQYTQRLAQLELDRQPYDIVYRDLDRYILPGVTRGLFTNTQTRKRVDEAIYNAFGTDAAERMGAGLSGSISSPVRPWFSVTITDPDLLKWWSVRDWLHSVEDRIRDAFHRSNVYGAMGICYLDLATFGTHLSFLEDDFNETVRAYPQPVGSYWLVQDERLQVCGCMRKLSMTAWQIMERFVGEGAGQDERKGRVSQEVKNAFANGTYGRRFDVVHVVEPNPEWATTSYDARFKKWTSRYYEVSGRPTPETFLRESGYDQIPILAPRWRVSAEDVYGVGPGWKALPDVKQLQVTELLGADSFEKFVDPALVGPTWLESRPHSTVPGEITYLDVPSGTQGLQPIYRPTFEGQAIIAYKQDIQQRIARAFMSDLFLMLSSDERNQPETAREVVEKHEEKVLQLGPVVEGLQGDLLKPLVVRTYWALHDRGLIPPPPPEVHGMPLRVEFLNIFSQAQKMLGVGALERHLGFVAQMGAPWPDALDKIDIDEAVEAHAAMVGVPPNVLHSEKELQALRKAKRDQQAAQQAAALAKPLQQAGAGVKDLGGTSVQQDSVLSQLLANAGAPPAAA